MPSTNPTTPLERVEAERLREVRAIIEATLRDFDVCAHVCLAGKYGRFENFTHVTATWSNLHWEYFPGDHEPRLRLRSKAADYVDDKDRQKRDLEWSVGVVSGLATMLAQTAMPLLEVAKIFDEQTHATHTPWLRDDPRDP